VGVLALAAVMLLPLAGIRKAAAAPGDGASNCHRVAMRVPASLVIDAPVLAVVGNHDRIFCGVVPCERALSQTQLEQVFYPAAESFRLAIVPEAGHALNHQRNAPRTDAAIDRWLADHVK
jgi:pimeloyl-ACP methyl ester carboxylesterase